jgi:hypothetical protein
MVAVKPVCVVFEDGTVHVDDTREPSDIVAVVLVAAAGLGVTQEEILSALDGMSIHEKLDGIRKRSVPAPRFGSAEPGQMPMESGDGIPVSG